MDALGVKRKTTGKPKLPNEMLLVNELIREYLTWAGYKCSCTVFSAGIHVFLMY